jgi:hypothetical protein
MAVLIRFDMADYRLIMNRLEVIMCVDLWRDCTAVADIPMIWIESECRNRSESKDGVSRFVLPSRLLDAEGNVVAEAQVHWHVKPWSRVRHRG